jgi:hypothetical protein
MLTTAFPFLLPHHIEGELPAKLRYLADDLDSIRTGTGPVASALATAPLLVDWRGVLTPMGLRLAGFAFALLPAWHSCRRAPLGLAR